MAIVIKKSSGGVAVMHIVEGADVVQCIEQFKSALPGEYVSHREMPDAAIPLDRTLRAAWDDISQEPVIDIDPSKLAIIKKNEIIGAIEALEVESKMNRGSRELALRTMEREAIDIATARGITVDEVLSSVPAYVKFKALDDQIKQLRDQLGALV